MNIHEHFVFWEVLEFPYTVFIPSIKGLYQLNIEKKKF